MERDNFWATPSTDRGIVEQPLIVCKGNKLSITDIIVDLCSLLPGKCQILKTIKKQDFLQTVNIFMVGAREGQRNLQDLPIQHPPLVSS